MQGLHASIRALLFGGLARQVRLLLLLSVALISLFLLLEFVVSLASTGPQDILAVTPSEETTFRVPNGVDLLEFLVLAVSIVLALTTLLASFNWPIGRASFRPSWSLAFGVLTSVALVAAGAYLAFSGVLGEPISYAEHEVKLTSLRSRGLALIAVLFLSVTVAGLINWRLLAASLVVWVIAAGALGLLETEPVDGLLLFPRTARIPVSANFAAAVESHQGVGDAASGESVDTAPSDNPSDSPQLLVTEVKTTQLLSPDSATQFRVSGALHTRYLRTTTGDVYSNGAWNQSDPVHILLDKDALAVRTLAPLVEELRTTQPGVASLLPHYSTATPLVAHTDQIEVTPSEEGDEFAAGVLPISKNLQRIDTPATYYPFSETLTVDSSVSSYRWESVVQEFALHSKIGAAPATAPAYLQLPDELPQRVYELAEQIGHAESPYLNALLLQVYLQDEYAYSTAAGEAEVPPPADRDPIDWFLFEHGTGSSGEFSSAFVLLARAMGIPARVVAGWVLEDRQGTATTLEGKPHQWAEIALRNLGWVRVDPAPEVDSDHALQTALRALSCCSSPGIREAAQPLIGSPDNSRLLRALFVAIEDERDSNTFLAVYSAATTTLTTLAFDDFIEIVLEDEDSLLRAAAAYGLGVLGDRRAAEALMNVLANDVDAEVRAASAGALGAVGKGKAEEALLRALATDPSVNVRVAAARALGVLKTNWTADEMIPYLRSASEFRVRAEVASALGEIRNSVALRPLIDTRSDDASTVVMTAANAALAKWSCTALIRVLEGEAPTVERVAAAELLGERACTNAILALGRALSDPDEEVGKAALKALRAMGADVTLLENGASLAILDDRPYLFVGTGTGQVRQAEQPTTQAFPVFEVSGAAQTSYLRTSVGDIYENGGWQRLDPVSIAYTRGTHLPVGVWDSFTDPNGDFLAIPAQRRSSPELFGFPQAPHSRATDQIQLRPAGELDLLPFGILPTSREMQQADLNGTFFPFSATFFSAGQASTFSWTSGIPRFSPEQLTRADAAADPAYTQLPPDLPARVQQLAEDITRPFHSPYAKAKALERYLSTQLTYAFADSTSTGPPAGQDPVDWFVFDSREGTCGQFSSAFAVMARSVGIPARMVSGWAISPTADRQSVYTEQAHQWAEIALEGIGWVGIDATPGGGPRSRVLRPGSPLQPVVFDTETTITRSASEVRRQTPFVVEGTVKTLSGRNVSGMTVELYINETKEHGGTKIGTTTSHLGRFSVGAELPADFELGPYQLLARAVGNERFTESWSDPDVKVFSGSGIELTGPAEAVLDAETAFTGRLTEDNGQAAAGRELAVTIDGTAAPSVVTDQAGRFAFSHSFSQLGAHWVEVTIEGEEFLLDNVARLDFVVVLPTEIALQTPASVEVGEQFLLLGELRGVNGSPLGEKRVLVQVGDNPQQSHSTSAEGRFTHTDTLSSAGEFAVKVSFPGDGPELASEETLPIEALYSVFLALDGPPIVRDGEEFQLIGTLRRIVDGRPVPDAEVQVTSGEPTSLVTDAEGMFTWSVRAAFDANAAHDPHESVQGIEAVLERTEQLASTRATLDVHVGLPRIVVEPLKPVTRGSEAILRGAVLLGTYPVPGAALTAGPTVAMEATSTGTFMHPYPVAKDEPLGSRTLVIAAPALEASVATPLLVKSAVNLIVTPEGSVRPGRMVMLRTVLLDDRGAGIAGATIRSSQGVHGVTDESGVALLELAVPEPEGLHGSLVEFTYSGDSLRTPLTTPYYWEAVITPAGFNWLLWMGIPTLLALAAAGVYADRRYKLTPLLLRRWKATPVEPVPQASDMVDDLADADEHTAPTPQPVLLQVNFQKAAADLADVWGPGEEVVIIVGVTDEDGHAIAGAVVNVSVADDAPSDVVVGDDGTYAFGWSGSELGAHTVSVEFAGDDAYLPSAASRNLRIVDFREEIVRLYNTFLDWARGRSADVTEQSTPREVEALLVSQGLPISQKALDELISRFEEADYSEHSIARRHYEAMYRAWSTVEGA